MSTQKNITEQNDASIIASRKSCSTDGVGLSHYILT
jgi:modified peptide precursor CbpA